MKNPEFIAAEIYDHGTARRPQVCANSIGYGTEEGCVKRATEQLKYPNRGGKAVIGIYRLVKTVKLKDVPVEIEEVACCDPVKKTK